MNITTLYVSQKYGNDSNRGFFRQEELKTIERALDIVSEIRRSGEVQPITIRVLDSVYNVTAPITVKNNVSSVTIEPEEKTLISGGIKIKGFKRDEFNGVNCYSVDLSSMENLEFSDFYVNGKAAKRTRYPQSRYLEPENVENHGTELFEGSKWFIAKEEDFETIKKLKNLKDCFISFNHFWVDEHTPIENFDIETRKIVFEYKSRFTIEPTHNASALRYIIENVAEGFQNPNEWYFDNPSKTLYYIPENENVKAEEIVGYIPITDKLICITGDIENKVKNIVFRNFELAYTKGDYKSKGEEPGSFFASDSQAVSEAQGSIELENAYSCAIENCNLYCIGVHGIVVNEGCSRIRIQNNEIRNMGAGGIVISGGAHGSNEKTHTYSNIVSDNVILHGGNRYFAACAILIKHSYENVISHNEIGYMYYTGISCGWVWGYTDSITHDNIIEKNHIHHLGFGMLSDMGGIYLLGRQHGTIVRNNHIHDIVSAHYGGWALYTDEGSSGIVLENNVCHDTSDNSYHQHFGKMNTVRNNIFAFSKSEPIACSKPETHTGIVVERNIIITSGTPVFREGYVGKDEECTQMIFSINNLIYDISKNMPLALRTGGKEYNFDEVQNLFGIDVGSIFADPMFEDIKKRNFSIKYNSPAYKIGFKPIDMKDVGVRR